MPNTTEETTMSTVTVLPKGTDNRSEARQVQVESYMRDERTGDLIGVWTVHGQYVPASRIVS